MHASLIAAYWLCLTPFALGDVAPDATETVRALSAKSEGAEAYILEGTMRLETQYGQAPATLLSISEFEFASASSGRYFLRLDPEDKDEYFLISNGEKRWAYVPELKQYTEKADAQIESLENLTNRDPDDERDLAETFARLIVPALADLQSTAETADFDGESRVKYGRKEYVWPVLRVSSRPNASGGRTLTELTLDPASLNIGRMVRASVTVANGERSVMRMTVDFDSLRLEGPVPDKTFEFKPPRSAKMVEAVPIPGQTGSFLLNRQAPDFEQETLEGKKIRLSDFRGHPVLLSFWATWCPPCLEELPELAQLYEHYRDKGLIILGIDDEDKETALRYARRTGLPFPTVHDRGSKITELYHLITIPSVFLINKEGKIVRFMKGARGESVFRAALSSVGL